VNDHSYTAADISIPIKVLHDTELVNSIINYKYILLRHLQLCPTNACNLNCKFCSCGDRNNKTEMPYDKAAKILEDSKEVGCRSITITGGGEPLMHPRINDIIKKCDDLRIGVGMVTNGLLLDRLTTPVKWCRISFDSNRYFSKLKPILSEAVKRFPKIDWAFSFVMYDAIGDLEKVIDFANNNHFTHIRVVSDILHPEEDKIDKLKTGLTGKDQKIIYQSRSKPSVGAKDCLISLLKPTISAEGNIYPCCGAQYAIKNSKRDFVDKMSMGPAENIKEIVEKQQHFDGSICQVCYYSGYNKLLSLLNRDIAHGEWV